MKTRKKNEKIKEKMMKKKNQCPRRVQRCGKFCDNVRHAAPGGHTSPWHLERVSTGSQERWQRCSATGAITVSSTMKCTFYTKKKSTIP